MPQKIPGSMVADAGIAIADLATTITIAMPAAVVIVVNESKVVYRERIVGLWPILYG